MRLLCVADLHAEEVAREYLKRFLKQEKPDVVLLAGDLTERGPVSFASDLLDDLDGFKVLGIAGNADTPEVARLLDERGVSLHSQVVEFEGVRFAGVNGASPRFNAGIEYSEEKFKSLLEPLKGVDVFVSHVPPFGTNASQCRVGEAGSIAVREWILREKPKIAFCGHTHQYCEVGSLGGTKLVSVQPLMECHAAIAEWPSLETKLL